MTHKDNTDFDQHSNARSPAGPAPDETDRTTGPAGTAPALVDIPAIQGYIRTMLAEIDAPPSVEALAGAPHLADWRLVQDDHLMPLRLAGVCTGHPRNRPGWVTTSALVWIDPEGTRARTWSRWYRLKRARPVPGELLALVDRQRIMLGKATLWRVSGEEG